MTLMPVGNTRADGSRASKSGASRWIAQRSISVEAFRRLVEGLAPHVPDVAEHLVADRHLDAVAEVAHRRAADEAVGRLHADRTHPAFAELLGHLGEHLDGLAFELDVELDGVVEFGQRATGELDVDHRAGNADDAAVLAAGLGRRSAGPC